MSGTGPTKLSSPARVGQETFIAVAWGGVAITLLFILFRFMVRIKVFGRLQPDDGLVLFSWISLLINASLWHVGQDALYEIIAVSVGELYPPPPGFDRRTEGYLRKMVAVFVFFYTGLWSIKLAFLLFFKRLGQNVRHQDKLWWVVLSITFATYVTCIGTIQYRCFASSFEYIQTQCKDAPGLVRFQRLTLNANMALDVVTDALIILVPVNLLRKVRLSVLKKLALGGLFSVTVVIMVFAITRAVVVTSYSHQPDQTWLYLWSGLEHAVSIVVACLASYPALFKSSEREKHRNDKHRNDKPGRLRRLFSLKYFTRIKSIIIEYSSMAKRFRKGSDELSDDQSKPAPPETNNDIYLETQVLRSGDGIGKFLQSGTFAQKDWIHRSPLNSPKIGETQTSCYSAV